MDSVPKGFRKNIVQWKEVIDHMANTGQNTIVSLFLSSLSMAILKKCDNMFLS
jgi:hypothetical protein